MMNWSRHLKLHLLIWVSMRKGILKQTLIKVWGHFRSNFLHLKGWGTKIYNIIEIKFQSRFGVQLPLPNMIGLRKNPKHFRYLFWTNIIEDFLSNNIRNFTANVQMIQLKFKSTFFYNICGTKAQSELRFQNPVHI